MEPVPAAEIQRVIELALAEDVGAGDITTVSTVPAGAMARAQMVAREPLVVSGLQLAEAAFRKVATGLEIRLPVSDGEAARAGQVLLEVSGKARGILTAERVALNFVQRLSGVATL